MPICVGARSSSSRLFVWAAVLKCNWFPLVRVPGPTLLPLIVVLFSLVKCLPNSLTSRPKTSHLSSTYLRRCRRCPSPSYVMSCWSVFTAGVVNSTCQLGVGRNAGDVKKSRRKKLKHAPFKGPLPLPPRSLHPSLVLALRGKGATSIYAQMGYS